MSKNYLHERLNSFVYLKALISLKVLRWGKLEQHFALTCHLMIAKYFAKNIFSVIAPLVISDRGLPTLWLSKLKSREVKGQIFQKWPLIMGDSIVACPSCDL